MSVRLTDFSSIESIRRALANGMTEGGLKDFASKTFALQEQSKFFSLIDTAARTHERNSSLLKVLKFTSSKYDGCVPPPWQYTFPEDLMNMETMVKMRQVGPLSFEDINEIIEQEYTTSKDKERLHRSAAFAAKVYERRQEHLASGTPYSIADFPEDKQIFTEEYPKPDPRDNVCFL